MALGDALGVALMVVRRAGLEKSEEGRLVADAEGLLPAERGERRHRLA